LIAVKNSIEDNFGISLAEMPTLYWYYCMQYNRSRGQYTPKYYLIIFNSIMLKNTLNMLFKLVFPFGFKNRVWQKNQKPQTWKKYRIHRLDKGREY